MAQRLVHSRALATLALAFAGCVDNATYPGDQPYLPTSHWNAGLGCVPNLDGRIDANELKPALGVAARYRIATNRTIDQTGAVAASGVRVWDWGWSAAAEQTLQVTAAPLAGQWYAEHFAPGTTGATQFAVPFDADGTLDAVYRHDGAGVWLLGMASREVAPKGGQTLLVYEWPVQVLKFPLLLHDNWTAKGVLAKAKLYGLPYAATDVYTFSADTAGVMQLPDITVDQAIRVRTKVTTTAIAGKPIERVQTQFFFECLGEVARAVPAANQTDPDFALAAEIRRLAL
ncbi:MAG: hypothetical protein FJ100_11375 [Deltaproteobacteria bacterium]|nr:hypothetical protein [Deltaproteobacteria bacterium]